MQKAESLPSDLAVMAARNIGLIPEDLEDRRKIIQFLIKRCHDERIEMREFSDFEVPLLRLGKGFFRKMACERCPLSEDRRNIRQIHKSPMD